MSWTSAYKTIREQMVRDSGSIGASTKTGAILPKMSGFDGLKLAAILVEEVVEAIKTAGYPYALIGERDETPSLGGFVDFVRTLATEQELTRPARISIVDWISKGKYVRGKPHVRYLPVTIAHEGNIDVGYFASPNAIPFHVGNGNDPEVTQIVGAWQALIVATANAVAMAPIRAQMNLDEATAWWSAYYNVTIALALIAEEPRPSTWQKIKGGVRYAAGVTIDFVADDVAEAAGRAVAGGAKIVGQAAGSAAKGFFDEAGMTAILVTGIALVVALS